MFLEESNVVATSLLEILSYRAQHQSDRQAYIFLQDGETESGKLTYGELDQQARAIACRLQAWQGERAILLYPSGLEFITAFFGCLYAGVVAVPAHPHRNNQKSSRLLSIVNDAQAKLVMTTASTWVNIEKLKEQQAELAELHLVITDAIAVDSQEFVFNPPVQKSIAFLQYTSGSTGTPKGVMVTHDNIIHNQQLIYQAFGHGEHSIGVSWLPLFHDMGLIGHVIHPIYAGITSILMPPAAFLQKPIRWLQAISKYRATTSGGPNFAYDLCVNKIRPEELSDLDLRSWDLAFNGAEPVRAETLERFSKTFADCGFNNRAFYPCYGMAETTLLTTGGDKGREPIIQRFSARELEQNSVVENNITTQESRMLVGCGRPYLDSAVMIVNPETLVLCEQGQVGEVCVRGGSVSTGYWNQPEATQETFQAYLKLPDLEAEPFLRTGDLGFFHNNELFIIGRLKDLIIIRGRNHYPQDIESTVESSHLSLQEACSATFSVEIEGEERLVIACEVKRTAIKNLNIDEIFREIQIAVLTEHELEVCEIVLLRPGNIPKTSSGKIQRRACKDRFLQNSLSVVERWSKNVAPPQEYVAPSTPSAEILANIFAKVLNVQTVGIHDNFFDFGGHSLLATQLVSQVRQAFQVDIPVRTVFESPTIAQLEMALTQLRNTSPGLLLPAIEPIEDPTAPIPLSFAQERLWFLSQLEGASATYNIPAAVRITGTLDTNSLQQALSEIVRRHQVLRTSFGSIDGDTVQVIHPDTDFNIQVIDLQTLTIDEHNRACQAATQQEAQTPFDLEKAPLIRCSLLQLSATEYIVLLTMHHIVSDGWSMGILIQELSVLYPAFVAGARSPLAELPIQYADFTVWQKKYLSGALLETQLNYWGAQLQGAPELLQLPTDRVRPSTQTYQGRTQSFTISSTLHQQLQALSRKSGATLFMTLSAAFSTLLYRYSGQSDILVGSPIANRNHSEIESLIGFFVNTLVLRTRFEDNPSFEQVLSAVRETTLQAYEHQDVPFEQVVEALNPQRYLSHSPIFQVMFVLQNAPMGDLTLLDVTLSSLAQESTISRFDLTLSMSETVDGLVGSWEYSTDLFDGQTIDRMTGHFENLLIAIAQNPQQLVDELPLLSAAELHQLTVEWNETATEYPQDQCIHQLFEEQVEQTPDAIAVVFEDEQLTYQELNQRANQLARHLQGLGVQPDVLVGICVERSLEMVVGLLGILKAGGAYVPLDHSYPTERLSYMLSDSGVDILLTQQRLVSSLPTHSAHMVCLDDDWESIELESWENLDTGIASRNLAYVIYTSGSTGQPKGTIIPHSGMMNYLSWSKKAYTVSNGEGSTVNSSIGFDATVTSLFSPLLVGRKVVLLPEEGEIEALKAALCSGTKFSFVKITPAHLEILNHLLDNEQINIQTQSFIVGGEALSGKVTAFWQKYTSATRIINEYGPTETVVGCCIYEVGQQSFLGNVPIGRPIANTQIYILDQHLQAVPIGVPGELHIGGDGLARGYLNRPELTAEKFIPNPFNPEKSARLYKTGDLARYLPDGNIEYLGRIDNQVKIRGFRIELGEIEAVLSSHPQVQQAVVVAAEENSGSKRLIAYVVSAEVLTTSQLREYLSNQLPAYMVPAVFITLGTFPLTPNGKIDRQALPAPDGEINRIGEYVAPSTAIETTLTSIWQELLIQKNVSIHDNFFKIGGDSILSIQIVSRARNAGIQITPKQMFQYQTIAELAKVANTTASVIAQQEIVTGSAPLTPIQKWCRSHNSQNIHHYNQSVLLEIPNNLSNELLSTAFSKLLEHHDALRLRFNEFSSTQVNQGLEDNLSFSSIDLSSTPKLTQSEALTRIATEFQASLNLSTGPIIKVIVFNLGQGEHNRLLIIIHHLAVDGMSWRILLSDLQVIHQQLITQQPIQLSPKTTAFIDWAEKIHHYAQSELIKYELDYWLHQNWSNATSLPLDHACVPSENIMGSIASVSVNLSGAETQALLGSVNEAYNIQINDVLLSALALCLTEWTGNCAVVIDLEGHGREELFEDVDLSRTVGSFTSLFPVLLQLPAARETATVLKSIKEQLRAIPNRGIGYGVLRYLCQDEYVNQQLQTIPIREICFNYLGQFDQNQATGWKFATESTGAHHSSTQVRSHLLNINCLIVAGALQVTWTYSNNVHTHYTIEQLAQSYIQSMRSLISHCG